MQKYYIRIIFLIPNYAFCSFLSLVIPSGSIYIETIRDMCVLPTRICFVLFCSLHTYRAWLIYHTLLSLLSPDRGSLCVFL